MRRLFPRAADASRKAWPAPAPPALQSGQLGSQRAVAVRRERGIALLMVLSLLALVTTVVTDFQFSSRVDIQLAYNARDELQAEYNALSALRFRALLLKQSRALQPLVQGLIGSLAGPGGAAGGGASTPISALMELIPVECGLMSQITRKVERGGGLKNSEATHEDFFPGECMATSQSEHSKLSVNLLSSNINGRNQSVASFLLGMLSDPRLRKHFETDDRNGQHAESPTVLIGALADWVDPDHAEQGNLGDEDRYYQSAKPPYRAKNAPFDSVAEMQLVYGMNDDLYNLLKDRITVHNADPLIELATAPIPMILAGLPAVLLPGPGLEVFVTMLQPLAARLAMLKSLGPLVPMSLSLLQSAMTDVGLMPYIDATKLQNVYTDRSSTAWYTILAQGQMGRASRKIRAVFQAMEGSFYYVRVE
jgi:hypothetical protein